MWDDLKLDYEYIEELKELVTKVLKPIERERFIILFSQFDDRNQYALFKRLNDFYKKPIKNYFWLIYDNEPQKYIEISREILSLFEGNLFYVDEEKHLSNYSYWVDLIGINS